MDTTPDNRDEVLETVGDTTSADPIFNVRGCNVHYGDTHAIKEVSLDIGKHEVISLIGPSGCGQVDLSALPQPDERHH